MEKNCINEDDKRQKNIHKTVLSSLKQINFDSYEIRIEETGSRLNLPNEKIFKNEKEKKQRKKNLCYADAILFDNEKLKILIEVVTSNPKSPNGIAGSIINYDRIAKEHTACLDLLFIVISEMKEYYCKICKHGHKISNTKHLIEILQKNNNRLCDILHEGIALNYRKTLQDYPITEYTKHIRPPSVIFLNKSKTKNQWDKYKEIAFMQIQNELEYIIAHPERKSVRLIGISELLPESIIKELKPLHIS